MMIDVLLSREQKIVQAIINLQDKTPGPLTNAMIALESGYSVATVKRVIRMLMFYRQLDRTQVAAPGCPGCRYRYKVRHV